jgi:hypothetical protein
VNLAGANPKDARNRPFSWSGSARAWVIRMDGLYSHAYRRLVIVVDISKVRFLGLFDTRRQY